MTGDRRTIAQRQRNARQEQLREYISNQKHEQHAVAAIEQMRLASEQFDLTKWDKVFSAHMRLLDKYLPAQKEVALDAMVDAVAEIRRVNVRGIGTGDSDT